MWDKFTNGIKRLTDVGFSLIAFGVVLQVLFGDKLMGFWDLDVVANIINIVNQIGSEGLVGLIALWILYWVYTKK
mgnify:CR=1 FL=1